CDHWRNASGKDPHMLVMDQKVTTQPVLAELDQRGIKFLTLRMPSPALLRQINNLAPADYKTITLNRPGRRAPSPSSLSDLWFVRRTMVHWLDPHHTLAPLSRFRSDGHDMIFVSNWIEGPSGSRPRAGVQA
ncbi:MAG: hypothetical protein ACRDTA_20095, partial [Pseudonocardiaceae bacterium]